MTGCSASVRARACVRVRAAPGGHAVRERRRIGDYKEKQYHCAARLRALRCCACSHEPAGQGRCLFTFADRVPAHLIFDVNGFGMKQRSQ